VSADAVLAKKIIAAATIAASNPILRGERHVRSSQIERLEASGQLVERDISNTPWHIDGLMEFMSAAAIATCDKSAHFPARSTGAISNEADEARYETSQANLPTRIPKTLSRNPNPAFPVSECASDTPPPDRQAMLTTRYTPVINLVRIG